MRISEKIMAALPIGADLLAVHQADGYIKILLTDSFNFADGAAIGVLGETLADQGFVVEFTAATEFAVVLDQAKAQQARLAA